MASLFRRRRSLIFKVIIGIPTLWFFMVFLLAYHDNLFFAFREDSNNIAIMRKGDDSRNENNNIRDNNKYRGNNRNDEANQGALLIHPPLQNNINNNNNNNNNNINIDNKNFHNNVFKIDDKDSESHHRKQQDSNFNNNKNNNNINNNNNIDNFNIKNTKNNNDNIKNKVKIEKPVDNSLKFNPDVVIPVDPNAPGENGRAVVINKDKLSAEERKIYDEGWQHNAFNQYASDMISLHRTLPDVRDEECKSIKYKENLPDTSVIVCFHNEAWTVLLRTVHSILNRSPPQLLKEIILVDDYSDMPHLKQPLTDYVEKLGKVKVVRTKQREGLIRARLLGYSVATGTVLTYLDSHCECTRGWLEPILDRIATDKRYAVTPVIDQIDDSTLHFVTSVGSSIQIGRFDWNLIFNWMLPSKFYRNMSDLTAPIRSPTMAGGLFAISRAYFTELGTYDAGMDIWGGENLELSFRIWMCGGTLEIIPCSHVGHIFRKRSPYKWRTGVNVVKKNSVRLAEVWMDEYKNYYYERFNYDLGDFGDVTDRKKLRERLKCHSFDWYIKNVYPDLFIPGEALASGEIRNKQKAMCVDASVDHQNMHKPVIMWPCHNQGGNQYWMLSKNDEIRRDDGCLDYSGGENVIIYPCHSQHGNQEWQYREDRTILHVNTLKCMEISMDGKTLLMKPCTGIDRQIWFWKRKAVSGGSNRNRL
ncbi:polypeptide N-acetylgalactosaminyltransferase 5-like isoform X2 [Octopus sinensis]|uniref:Polypeptide N-acetylgalactosaminyltransferase n=1 Tax=Octopus sinensis TaxID=2607531 RepID=A0A6P7TRS9_9MOLL|nr:polypeptide N-acetylgalactosaminyltransferase 5-like isoform X2 [Octopus sinensis]